MLQKSQPLDPKVAKKLGLDDDHEVLGPDKDQIISQRIGTMFDDLLANSERTRSSLKTRISWQLRRIKDAFHDIQHTIRNHRKWHKTLCKLRPWEGFDGFLSVMITHLQDYAENEEKCGYSAPDYKEQKIGSAKETIALLERMKDPDGYIDRLRDEVRAKYPSYWSLITEHSFKMECSRNFNILGLVRGLLK